MPNYGTPPVIGTGEYAWEVQWSDWAGGTQLTFEGNTPTRVLWRGLSGCNEKYQMVPEEYVNPEN